MIGITMINISKTRVTDEGIRTICKSVNLTNLVDLIIKDLKISIKSLRLIMTSMYLSPFFNLQGVFEIYVNDTRLS